MAKLPKWANVTDTWFGLVIKVCIIAGVGFTLFTTAASIYNTYNKVYIIDTRLTEVQKDISTIKQLLGIPIEGSIVKADKHE